MEEWGDGNGRLYYILRQYRGIIRDCSSVLRVLCALGGERELGKG
jgi:hypothetical protein